MRSWRCYMTRPETNTEVHVSIFVTPLTALVERYSTFSLPYLYWIGLPLRWMRWHHALKVTRGWPVSLPLLIYPSPQSFPPRRPVEATVAEIVRSTVTGSYFFWSLEIFLSKSAFCIPLAVWLLDLFSISVIEFVHSGEHESALHWETKKNSIIKILKL